MIRVKHSSGNDYYRSEELTTYATVWNSALATKGGIRLYDGDIKLVADFRLGDLPDELLMVSYPHNDKKGVLAIAEQKENEIRLALEAAMQLEPERRLFTIDLAKDEVKVLKKEHFNRFSSIAVPQDELFTFDNPDPKVGFPRTYLHEKNQRMSTSYGEMFRVLVKASRVVFPYMYENPTSDGARFVYMLFNSYNHLDFQPHVPNLTGVRWPSKLNWDIPQALDVAELGKFLVEVGIDKLVLRDGKIVAVDEVEEAEVVDQPDEDEAWDEKDMPLFMFDTPEETKEKDKLSDLIWTMIDQKGFFNLGDAFDFGLDRVMAMVPISNKIIPANIDLPGIVRKMCIYQGMFHIIPLGDQIERLAEILDLDEEVMKICTDEDYPRNNLLPAPGK